MSDECNTFDRASCQRRFDLLFEKLDRFDEAIRGNGKPGLIVRLDRLEQSAGGHSKLIWLMLGAIAAGIGTAITAWMVG